MYGLFDENGDWRDNKSGMENVIVDYFTKLFHLVDAIEMTEILETTYLRVATAMNEELLAPFTDEEVKRVLFQMHLTKDWAHMGCR